MNVRDDTPFRLLTRHFFGALFDLGFLSESQTSSLAQLIAGIAGALLAAGFILARVMMYRYGALADLPNAALYEQTFLTDHVFLIAVPMWIVAFVAVLVGPSLLPDETDFRVLGAMPVTRPVVFGAKLAALVLFIGLFVAASEAALLPMFTVTTISPHREHAYAALLPAYLVTGALGALFAALSVTAVQALLLLLVPRRVLLTVSAATGSLMLFALVVGVPLVGHVPSFAQAFSSGSPWLRVFPPAWFVGLEQWFVGESQYSALALAALGALLVAGSIAGAAYLVLYRHFDRVMIRPARGDAPTIAVRATRTGGVLRRPAFTAVWAFTWLTLRRSALHQGVLVAVAALGVAVVISHVLGLDVRAAFATSGWRRRELIGALTWAPFVLMFTVALAVRAALLVPIESRANWIFRLTEQPGTRAQQMDAPAGAMVCLGVIAPCALLAPVQWMLAGPVSVMSVIVTALCGGVLVELLLLDWRRVPFTCSYLLGKGAVPLTLLKAVFSFVFFTNVGAALARVSRTSPGSAGVLVLAVLLATVIALRRLRTHLRTQEPLEYEDTLPSEMNPLRLSPD
jgi:hypothetical protein